MAGGGGRGISTEWGIGDGPIGQGCLFYMCVATLIINGYRLFDGGKQVLDVKTCQ